MALSLRRHDHFGDASRADALSVAHVGNAFVDRVYGYLSPIYDIAFGPILQPGRVKAMERLAIEPGQRVLEVGAGTGINAPLYPRHCQVTAIDLSGEMLDRARERIAALGLTHIRLLEADAAQLTFADESFDRVYAPYTISVVPDPVRVVREMCRVCRAGGRIVILNHFRSTNRVLAGLERAISPVTIHVGFRADLDLDALMEQTGLRPLSVEKVNVPPIWSLITAVKREPSDPNVSNVSIV
jgi:phosphatidylethanolamine/phosphatidyl-N-methylethanolamine N-methyltransferase